MIAPAAMLAVGTALAVRRGERNCAEPGQGRITGIQSTFALVDVLLLVLPNRFSANSTADDECPAGRSSNVVND
jgi:hypothetical protein